jgi:hypothetical protein
MSVATLEAPKPGALLVGGKPPEPQFVQCVKQACAFYCGIQNGNGETVGGGCALALIPQALMSLQSTIVDLSTDAPDAPSSDAH